MRSQPSIEARILGSIKLSIGGEPLVLARHALGRQLQLLKVLVALGGQSPLERITEVLWPDAEGDKALQAFHSAAWQEFRPRHGFPNSVKPLSPLQQSRKRAPHAGNSGCPVTSLPSHSRQPRSCSFAWQFGQSRPIAAIPDSR